MEKMKYFIIGLCIGMMFSIPLAWAAQRATLVNGGGVEIGTTSDPITITIQ